MANSLYMKALQSWYAVDRFHPDRQRRPYFEAKACDYEEARLKCRGREGAGKGAMRREITSTLMIEACVVS